MNRRPRGSRRGLVPLLEVPQADLSVGAPAPFNLAHHPFIADRDGLSCRVCCLPRANQRHREAA